MKKQLGQQGAGHLLLLVPDLVTKPPLLRSYTVTVPLNTLLLPTQIPHMLHARVRRTFTQRRHKLRHKTIIRRAKKKKNQIQMPCKVDTSCTRSLSPTTAFFCSRNAANTWRLFFSRCNLPSNSGSMAS